MHITVLEQSIKAVLRQVKHILNALLFMVILYMYKDVLMEKVSHASAQILLQWNHVQTILIQHMGRVRFGKTLKCLVVSIAQHHWLTLGLLTQMLFHIIALGHLLRFSQTILLFLLIR